MTYRVYPIRWPMLFAAAVLTACATPPKPAGEQTTEPAAATAPSNETVQALFGVDELRAELAQLRNEVEVQRNELETMRKRQRELYDDLDYRLRARERGGAATLTTPPGAYQAPATRTSEAPAGAMPPGTETGAAAELPSLAPPLSQIQAPGTEPGAETAMPGLAPQAPAEVQTVTVASAEEQAAYDAAFDLLKDSRYSEAITAFQALMGTFPAGALVDDAQYWIGEALYVTRDFEGALGAFENVVLRYPNSQRVPEAMLKVGYIQYEMGDKEQARQTLSEVIARYPGSRVAISAQTRLAKIDQGG